MLKSGILEMEIFGVRICAWKPITNQGITNHYPDEEKTNP